ncbi:alpha/beta hydrolase [Actinomadura oligospora]|uniref:alpha/beta hydrolase n=1 Tax=Actinomadura oligospora TaxID=111804 RepID=UPI0004B8CBD7|nr:alpha/beta hydrolase [Actinomadura oligospora]
MDPELEAFLPALPDPTFSDIEAGRELRRRMAAARPADPETVSRTDITDVAEARVRLYRPKRLGPGGPAILWMHGGGFCVGDLDTTHREALSLADEVGATVASVDYRLAPEHPYPAALDDCHRALVWLAGQDVDPSRIAVAGVSAGGGLAAALALRVRDLGGPAIRFQALLIPELDDRLDTPSMRAFTDTPGWTRPNAEISWRRYLGGREDVPPHAAPARAEDLSGLPPAYISAAELDPLRDEALIYGTRLLQAGVSTELHVFAGTFHGSAAIPSRVSDRQKSETAEVLRRALEA